MAAPSLFLAGSGATDAGGAWQFAASASHEAGKVLLVHIVQDGSTADAVALTSAASTLADLSGTTGALTYIGSFPIGSPTVAYHYLWIGRIVTAAINTYSGTNSTSEDVYHRCYSFSDVSTGTTLATVIENSTAGSTANTAGTDGTITDAGVTTLGPDRLALQFIGISDDNALADFTGESGGDWTEAVAEYAESSGTDATLGLQSATITSAGTINGGTTTNSDATDGWGVVGFALIGTTLSERQPRYGFVHYNDPALV